ncbi:MAG: tRNA lysidine(34) synthetase TilS [Sphaerochaetaceae bacterium]|jgi:tRNA(Ile)-lysidine synthase|nr:tRNA lysidine(34) synthetase TilS [Sphaerochaetaceae bacterium]
MSSVFEKVSEFMENRQGGVLAAFSGGADSLGLLIALCKTVGADNVAAAYVDHGIRSRAELEQEIALNRQNCQSLGVKFNVCTLESEAVSSLSRQRGCGTEEAARVLRYQALESARCNSGLKWIATAHNADDQAETVLMRLLSGKAVASLAGIREQSLCIIRPVLGCTHQELQQVCTDAGMRWSDDSTNSTDDYLRNRIRHQIMPAVSSVFPGCRQAILRFSEEMQELSLPEFDISDGAELGLFKGLGTLQKKALVYQIWDKALEDDFVPLGRSMMERILEAVDEGRSINIAGSGVWVSIIRGRLFVRREALVPPWSFELDMSRSGQRIELPGSHVLLRGDCNDLQANPDGREIYIYPHTTDGRMCVRQARDGDFITLKGGRKSVLELMQEMGIPRPDRGLVPLICDESGVIAVMGKAFGGRDRIARKCRCTLAPNVLSLYIVE